MAERGGLRTAGPRARLTEPMPDDGHWGWTGPLLATLLAGVLRFVDLGRPHQFVFDETFYAKDAWSLLHAGYARIWAEGANERVLAGATDGLLDAPAFVVHPDVGKWVIAGGEAAFGLDPVGWRVGVAVAGTLTVLVLARAVRRLTRSAWWGTLAGLLLAVDGMAITESRTAVLDGVLTLWVVCAVACLLVDRDDTRARWQAWQAPRRSPGPAPAPVGPVTPVTPVTPWRPWRLAAGVALGLACGTKWSGAYVLAVLGLLTVAWDVGARRALGARRPLLATVRLDAVPAFLTVAGSAALTYLASWVGWIASDGGWSRQWAASNPAAGAAGLLPDWVRSLWHFHGEMLTFHTGLAQDHPYASDPWGWLVLTRPVLFAYSSPAQGCSPAPCSATVLALGNPALWWGGVLALAACGWLLVRRRDWRAGLPLAGLAATWVPWLFTSRTSLSFYAVVVLPFLVIAVVLTLQAVAGPAGAPYGRRVLGLTVVSLYVATVGVLSLYFLPVWTGQVIPYEAWYARMWFRRAWI